MPQLSDLTELKTILEINPLNTAEDAKLLFFLGYATDWIAEYLNRPGMFMRQRIEYYDGCNTPFINLKSRPVITDQLAVYVDPQGNFALRSGGGAYDAATRLTIGVDYVLRIDQPDGSTSRCGILQRINGVWSRPYTSRAGWLTPFVTQDTGSVKVSYFGGWTVDGLPSQLRFACNLLASKMRYIMPVGMELNSENYKDRSISIANKDKDYLMSTVKDILFTFRNWAW